MEGPGFDSQNKINLENKKIITQIDNNQRFLYVFDYVFINIVHLINRRL